MPLIKGKSQKSFVKNLKTEMHEGKPMKQSLAIAYAMKRKAEKNKMADGGEAKDLSATASDFFSALKNPKPAPQTQDEKYAAVREQNKKNMGYSEGGQVHKPGSLLDEEEIMHEMKMDDLNHDTYQVRPTQFNKAHVAGNMSAMHEDSKKLGQHMVDMNASSDMHEQGLVDRIMEQKSKNFSGLDRFSKGGQVANQDHGHNNNELAGFSPNEFDDLVLRDDLESSYGDDDNSGDNLGNAQEDADRKDIVARIMASRKKKDKLPNPA